MPVGVLNAIKISETGNEHAGDMISATSLNGCQRKMVLERKLPYFEEPHKLYYAVRGTLIHGFLESGASVPGMISEKRIYKTITTGLHAPWVLSGRIDAYLQGSERSTTTRR
jgi:hypothetical protein